MAYNAITINDIIGVVSEYYGVSVIDILSSRKTEDAVLARRVAINIAAEVLGLPYSRVAGSFYKGYGAVRNAVNWVNVEVGKNDRIKQDVRAIHVKLEALKVF